MNRIPISSALSKSERRSLALMNEVTYVEAARVFAGQTLVAAESDERRIERAFRKATARPPRDAEKDILLQRLKKLRGEYEANPDAAIALIETGDSPRNESLAVADHAAFTGICLLILNLDETLTRE